jgi:predicted enzyme related to lactoylglutathione lyase
VAVPRHKSSATRTTLPEHKGYFHWALTVEDLDTVFAQVLDAGATEVTPPAPAARAGARFAYVKDPEGNLLELIQPAR